MGSIYPNNILQNPSVVKYKGISHRKHQYLASKKTDRKVVKHEQNLQIEFCDWLRETVPGVHFRSDTGSGGFSSEYEKEIHNRQQSDIGLPDITIFAARRGYHALTLELKEECHCNVKVKHKDCALKMQRDGHKIRLKTKKVRPSKKYPTGIKVIERDYKIRLKGDWKNLHVERQHLRHEELKKDGYCAGFGIGLNHLKKITCWYFDIPYIENKELF
jgi:hypothetical protein